MKIKVHASDEEWVFDDLVQRQQTIQSSTFELCNFRDATGYCINPLENSVKGACFSFPDVLTLSAPFEIDIDAY